MKPTVLRARAAFLRFAQGAALVACAVFAGASASSGAWAQTLATPSAEQMIEQLRAAPPAAPSANAPRTRSLRNLAVEAAPAASAEPAAGQKLAVQNAATPTPAAPAARPTLSLLIQFDFNSARVKAESQQALANLAQALRSPALSASAFAVEGHTDAKGKPDYNLHLSQQRADAVVAVLARLGVQPERLHAAGKGATELANSAEPNAAENRRVRIVNLD